MPPSRRARDRRHGRIHPVAPGSRSERDRAREGARGQGARVRRRLRRHLGRASRSRTGGDRGVRRRARRAAEPDRAAARGVRVTAEQLLDFESRGGEITEAGLHTNVSVGARYLDAWLHGVGAAAIDNLMEDAATAEISRAQVWSWVKARPLRRGAGARGDRRESRRASRRRSSSPSVALGDTFVEFLTLPAYDSLRREPRRPHKADDIALAIEEAIVSGELAPGTVLRQEQLSGSSTVSRTPVREALRRLAALGLVSFVPNRGFRVRTLSREEMHEAFLVAGRARESRDGGRRRRRSPTRSSTSWTRRRSGLRGLTRALRAREPGERPRDDHGRMDAREPRFPRRDLPRRRTPLHRADGEERAAHVLGPGRVGAGQTRRSTGSTCENERQHRAIRQALAAGSPEGARVLRASTSPSFDLLETILEQVGPAAPRLARGQSPSLRQGPPLAKTPRRLALWGA